MSFASVFSRFHPLPAANGTARFAGGGRASPALGVLGALAAACVFPGVLQAQNPGTQDTSFTSSGLGSTIYAISVQIIDQNEIIFVGGDSALEDYLYDDGDVDYDFKIEAPGNASRIIYTAVPQVILSDADQDKTLVGGLFGKTPKPSGNPGTGPAMNIDRLDSNGDVDASFDPGTGANDYVTSIVPEANGSIYVGGNFDHFNKIEHHHVVRLNIDGSLDNTFSSSLNINDSVLNVADAIDPATHSPNGQILVVGTFNRVDQTNTAKIARLNNDGSLDTSFNPVIDTRVLTVAVQPDGKIIIGGSFGSVNGTAVNNIARLNMDGSLDNTFSASITANPPGSPDETAVYVLKLQTDGRIYAGGNFFSADGTTREYLARLLPNGSLDTSFDPATTIINSVQSIAIQADNNILIGETVSRKVNNIFPASLIRLFSDNPTPPTVYVKTIKNFATELVPVGTAKRGRFQLVRSGSGFSSPLTVYLETGGDAVSGVDYKPLAITPYSSSISEVTFPANVTAIDIGVKPTGNTLANSPVFVSLKLRPDQTGADSYTPVSPTNATISISND